METYLHLPGGISPPPCSVHTVRKEEAVPLQSGLGHLRLGPITHHTLMVNGQEGACDPPGANMTIIFKMLSAECTV